MSTARNVTNGFHLWLLASLLLLASCSKEVVTTYSISTGSVGGNYIVAGRALARAVNKNRESNGFQFDNVTSIGSVANINAIIAGDAQFGIAQADHQYQALYGSGNWADKGAQEDLRAIFSMYTESVSLLVGADTDIRSINDLKGKVVDIGADGSGTRLNAIDALQAAGLDWEKDIRVSEENADVRLASFMHGEIDAFFFTAGHPNTDVKFATFSVRGVRIVPLANIDRLIAAGSYYTKTSIPSGLYQKADNESDIETVGVNAILLASAATPDDVVYAVTKAAFENIALLAEYSAEFSAVLNDRFLEGIAVPIHPGALRYYREAGIEIPPD